jgi:hypothetical protein
MRLIVPQADRSQAGTVAWSYQRNWMGRLLELVRSELALQNLGAVGL